MKTAVDLVSHWLLEQLSRVPKAINTVYVEWNNSYLEAGTPCEVVFVTMATFGFEHLVKGSFDCSNQDHLYELGNLVWQGRKLLDLREADFPELNWTDVLKDAATIPEIRAVVRSRNLLLLVGYHDDAVYDVS
jgi:hypothetical protein